MVGKVGIESQPSLVTVVVSKASLTSSAFDANVQMSTSASLAVYRSITEIKTTPPKLG